MENETNQNQFYDDYVPYDEWSHPFVQKMDGYRIVKRLVDIVIALLCLPIALVLIGFFAVLIKLETTGPVFFVQERVGWHGKLFDVRKLRSMRQDAEKWGAKWAVKNDPRVTRVGRFIRKTRIDELPQLWNVIKGDMSLIGPRPERPVFTEMFMKEIPSFSNRLHVKPGLTGWAQVNGGYDMTPHEKLQYDLYYIRHLGAQLDLMIAFRTVKVLLTGDGAR